ncbi:MAG: SDR family NAD(P)-dependent oxidoreductase [Chloroflexota bacterium]
MPNALIWGASGGIGSALVKTLKANGWQVHAAARSTDNIPAEADETYTFDASQPESYKEIPLLLAHDGVNLDLVVYAAGGIISGKMEDLGADNWNAVIDANLNGAYLGLQSVMHLVPKGGHLMVIGAYVDKIMLPKFGAYTVAKGGLEPMMTIFSKENRRKNFTLVRPPAVDSAFWDNVPFNMPDGAMSTQQVADAILNHYNADQSGTLDL